MVLCNLILDARLAFTLYPMLQQTGKDMVQDYRRRQEDDQPSK